MAEWKTYIPLAPVLRDRLDAYAEYLGISRAAAIRFLLNQALDAQHGRYDPPININYIADAHITEED